MKYYTEFNEGIKPASDGEAVGPDGYVKGEWVTSIISELPKSQRHGHQASQGPAVKIVSYRGGKYKTVDENGYTFNLNLEMIKGKPKSKMHDTAQLKEGKIKTIADQRAEHDKTMKNIVNKAKKYFAEHLVDKDCSVSYEHDDKDHKVSFLTLSHHDLMHKGQEAADTNDLISLAAAHENVKKVERLHLVGHQLSFLDYRRGGMPSVSIAVHHQ